MAHLLVASEQGAPPVAARTLDACSEADGLAYARTASIKRPVLVVEESVYLLLVE